MKYFEIKDHKIHFIQTGKTYNLDDISKTEVITPVHQKNIEQMILNATVNALTNSISNGNELIDVCIRVSFKTNEREILTLNEKPLIRNNLDYHATIKQARELQKQLRS